MGKLIDAGIDMIAYLIFAGFQVPILLLAMAVVVLPFSTFGWHKYSIVVIHSAIFIASLFLVGCVGDGFFVLAFRDRIYFTRDPIGDFVPWLPSANYMVDASCGGHPIGGATWSTLYLAWGIVALPVWLAAYCVYRYAVRWLYVRHEAAR